ncbi:hypothetical protein NEOLEDRAFT_1130557, partial [Neolentinus lepideus HHB14362 ss-1]
MPTCNDKKHYSPQKSLSGDHTRYREEDKWSPALKEFLAAKPNSKKNLAGKRTKNTEPHAEKERNLQEARLSRIPGGSASGTNKGGDTPAMYQV